MDRPKKPSWVVAGGDVRAAVAALELARKGHTVTLWRSLSPSAGSSCSQDPLPASPEPTEKELRQGGVTLCSAEEPCPGGEAFLLPIPVTRDGVRLTGPGAPLLCCLLSALSSFRYAVGGGIPASLTAVCRKEGVRCYDLLEDPAFVLQNAYLTSRAALGYLLLSSPHSPAFSPILVVGFGRIGEHLVRLALAVGFPVRVVARRREARVRAEELGAEVYSPDRMAQAAEGVRWICNTVPAPLLPPALWESLPPRVTVMELATGHNFPTAPTRATLLHLPGLPGRVYPKEAGRLVARTASDLISPREDDT